MSCEKCEALKTELKINSETILKVAQDNRMMREYITKLEERLSVRVNE